MGTDISRRALGAETSRQSIFKAAAAEFASEGFAGASVDRIARAAGLNKAMIYYHFASKADLYRHVLDDMFSAVEAGVRRLATSGESPEARIRSFVESIALEAEARPHFPPIWCREIADGGTRLDNELVGRLGGILKTLAAIIRDGVAAGQFTPVPALLVHAGIVGPLVFYYATGGLRLRIDRAGVSGASGFDRDEVIAHIQRVALATLRGHI
jgi:TetR/AcrR family transcriptional regulator